jgi:hypothetical protein
MHRREINKLIGVAQEKGYTMVPLQMYIKGKRAKVEIALVRGSISTTSGTPSPSATRIAAWNVSGKTITSKGRLTSCPGAL